MLRIRDVYPGSGLFPFRIPDQTKSRGGENICVVVSLNRTSVELFKLFIILFEHVNY
jgi:hypothetical protein